MLRHVSPRLCRARGVVGLSVPPQFLAGQGEPPLGNISNGMGSCGPNHGGKSP